MAPLISIFQTERREEVVDFAFLITNSPTKAIDASLLESPYA